MVRGVFILDLITNVALLRIVQFPLVVYWEVVL